MNTTRNFFNPTNNMLVMTGVATVLAGGILAATQPASAVSIGTPPDDEKSLQEILDDITIEGNIDAETDQIGSELFTNTILGSSAYLTFEYADFAPDNEFGIYEAGDSSNKIALFDGVDDQGTLSNFTFFANGNVNVDGTTYSDFGNKFGFYLENDNNTFFSQDSLNPEGYAQSVIYQGSDDLRLDLPGGIGEGDFTETDLIVAFEDMWRGDGSDSDFNDMVVTVSDVKAVPEPSAMAALGVVGGLMAFARRRRQ